ncbi:MAG: hypothetical protein DRI57_32225, partial [Deltaproteobacteria bacterium]
IFFWENSFHKPRMNTDESAVCVHLRFTICEYLKTWPITYNRKSAKLLAGYLAEVISIFKQIFV